MSYFAKTLFVRLIVKKFEKISMGQKMPACIKLGIADLDNKRVSFF
jgi:hypothetical protein